MDIKTGPEREARRRKLSLDAVLDLAAEEWRKKSASEPDGEDEQRRLREAAVGKRNARRSGASAQPLWPLTPLSIPAPFRPFSTEPTGGIRFAWTRFSNSGCLSPLRKLF